MSATLFVVPEGIEDPTRPSGGNTYDRHLIRGLRELGWSVPLLAVEATGRRDDAALERALAAQPDGSAVLVDGLLATAMAGPLVRHSQRLRLVLLVHMPQENPAERRVSAASASVVATSEWTRSWLINAYQLPGQRIRVVQPGVEAAPPTRPSFGGGRLVCVAAVRKHKGQDVLMKALAQLAGLEWRCTCVGSLDLDPVFSARVQTLRESAGLADQVRFAGPLTGDALAAVYEDTDLLVLPSLMETYGMVLTEALARGVPVIASDTGGIREAIGADASGTVPGMLVAPGDAAALAGAIKAWLGDEELRGRLREAAAGRRQRLCGWSNSAEAISHVLKQVAA